MKKSIYSIVLLFSLVACGGGEQSIEDLIKKGDQEAIKGKKTEISTQLRELEAQLEQIEVALDSTQNKKLPLISALNVDSGLFKHYVEVQGNILTDQDVLLFPEVQGVLEDLKVSMGQVVRKGQSLAVLDDGGIQQQLSQAKEQLSLAQITFERQKRLWDQKIGSEIEYLQAETQYKSLKENVTQLEKTLQKANVTAPYSGVIDEVVADEGQLMVPGQTPILRVVNLDNMYIHADVPETYLSSVKKDKEVLVSIPVLGKKITTKVSKVGNYINPNNRTFLVKINVPNGDREIKPNLTAKLEINDYLNPNAILIPQAIINEDSKGNQYVYRVERENGDAIVRKVNIETGKKTAEEIEVLSGLKAGDQIVEEGARTVKDGQEVEIIKER